jgi:hypothetical protein
MPRTDGGNGRAAQYHPLDARAMERACRRLAADLRREYAAGWGPVPLTCPDGNRFGGRGNTISRLEAADSLECQADRWADEVRTGVLNATDRGKLGF